MALEGFKGYPDDFLTFEVQLDEVLWDTGFVSLRPGDWLRGPLLIL